jgi:hypothetical protein
MINLNPKWWLWMVTGMNLIAKPTLLRLATLQALRVNKSRSLSSICCRWNVWLGSMVIVHTSLMCKGLSKHTLVPIEWVNNLKIRSSQLALAWKTEVCLSFSMSKGLSKHTLVPIEWVNNLKIHSSQLALAWKTEVCLSFSMSKGLSKHTLVPIEWVNNLKIHSSQFALAWKREVCLSFSMSTVREICTNMQVHVLIRANSLRFKNQSLYRAVLSFIYHYACALLFRFIVYDDSGRWWI